MEKSKWIKSKKSAANGQCVEVMHDGRENSDQVLVRCSRFGDIDILSFTEDEWRAFIDGAKNGEFDL